MSFFAMFSHNARLEAEAARNRLHASRSHRILAEEIIIRTENLLLTPAHWCQLRSNLVERGVVTRRCLGLAMHHATGQMGYPCGELLVAYELAKAAVTEAAGMDINEYNDAEGRTLADIHAVLREAKVTIRQGLDLPSPARQAAMAAPAI